MAHAMCLIRIRLAGQTSSCPNLNLALPVLQGSIELESCLASVLLLVFNLT